jgi:hypothetical protein
MVLLRKSIPQKRNLKAAAELNVSHKTWSIYFDQNYSLIIPFRNFHSVCCIVGKSTSSNHKFEIQKDYLHLRCETTSTGKSVIFINHFCGGSGCADLGNYGIIEANTGKVILEPNEPFKGNAEKAKEIMGKELKPFACKQAGSEICMHSKIELG